MSPGSFTQLVDLVKRSDPQAKKALSGRFFQRMMALVRSRLYSEIGGKDVSILDSILESVVQNHAEDDINWSDEECLMYLIGRVALRHCNTHNKRWQRDPERHVRHVSIGIPKGATADNPSPGLDPADTEPSPEAVVEFADFLTRFSPRQRQIIQRLLDDVAVVDIANELECASRTIYRELDAIGTILRTELTDDDEPQEVSP
jgi:DNA-directed RNA polymerase specialized sigma24 family protein